MPCKLYLGLLAEKGGLDENGEEYPCAIPSVKCLRLGVKIKQQDLPSYAPMWAKSGTWIRGALEHIYASNPMSRLPPGLPPFRLFYYRRFSFISASEREEGERFHVFKTDNIIEFQGGLYGQLISIFSANILDISDFFCLVYPLTFNRMDEVLNVSVWKVTGEKRQNSFGP